MKIPIDHIQNIDPTLEIDEQQLTELTESIKEQGLSHPIIVRPVNNLGGISSNQYCLASGEKRLLAHIRLGLTEIEAEVRDIDEKKAKEVRLHENLKRFNLPWWDQVLLVEQLHNLRQEEHGIATVGRPSKDEAKVGWSLRDTAEELSVGVGSLSQDLSLARALKNDATLHKVRDKKTALRLIHNIEKRHQSELEANLPSNLEANETFFGDSATILSHLPANSIHHCITDPPWIRFFDKALTIDDRTLPVFKELYRVLKNPGMLYLFCGLDDYHYYYGYDEPNPDNLGEKHHVKGKLEYLGFDVAPTPLIWRKFNALSRRGVRAWEYDRDFEFIIVAAKGSPTLTTSRRLSGIKDCAIVPPMKMIHPNEKPVALIEEIIDDCSYEGNIIIDPFAGSGVLGEACLVKKRKYMLCERDPEAYRKIKKRLGKV